MSIVNIGQMITGLLARIMTFGFGIDWSLMSLFYSKFRFYCFQVCTMVSMTCVWLATIDQYFATCSHPRWQEWSNIKLARRLLGIFVFIWIFYNVPYLIYFNHVASITTGIVTCILTNDNFQQYINYANLLILGKDR
jgi:hypothetical protein